MMKFHEVLSWALKDSFKISITLLNGVFPKQNLATLHPEVCLTLEKAQNRWDRPSFHSCARESHGASQGEVSFHFFRPVAETACSGLWNGTSGPWHICHFWVPWNINGCSQACQTILSWLNKSFITVLNCQVQCVGSSAISTVAEGGFLLEALVRIWGLEYGGGSMVEHSPSTVVWIGMAPIRSCIWLLGPWEMALLGGMA